MHRYGFHTSGAPAPLLLRRPTAASRMVDCEIHVSIYGIIFPTAWGCKSGARNKGATLVLPFCGELELPPGELLESFMDVVRSVGTEYGAKGNHGRPCHHPKPKVLEKIDFQAINPFFDNDSDDKLTYKVSYKVETKDTNFKALTGIWLSFSEFEVTGNGNHTLLVF